MREQRKLSGELLKQWPIVTLRRPSRGRGLIFMETVGVEQREVANLKVNVKISKSIGNRIEEQNSYLN